MRTQRRSATWPLVIAVAVGGCDGRRRPAGEAAPPVVPATPKPAAPAPLPTPPADAPAPDPDEARWTVARMAMVDDQLVAGGVRDPRVLAAMRKVPRHRFVPDPTIIDPYDDSAHLIGYDQTISQPYVVAVMTEAAAVGPGDRVLEIGTGSGYQAAILRELTDQVYTIEIVEPLGQRAAATLERLGYRVQVRIGDGYLGWPEAAPFDAIVVTAAPPTVPAPLRDQLAMGGRLVIPVGDSYQELMVITRTPDGYSERRLLPVAFVPMTGVAQLDAGAR